MTTTPQTEEPESPEHPPMPDRGGARLLIALALLVVLTSTSWALAHVALGPAATPVALTIAVLKASIVVLVFMEVGHYGTPARVVGLVTIIFIVLLSLGTVADVGLR